METGRPLISGDGVIAQVERFATKMVFNRLNPKYFNRALQIMIQKSEKPRIIPWAFKIHQSAEKS